MIKRESVNVSGYVPREVYDAVCRDGLVSGLTVSKMIAQALELYYKSGGATAYLKMKLDELAAGKPAR
jgi:hypothetical protein